MSDDLIETAACELTFHCELTLPEIRALLKIAAPILGKAQAAENARLREAVIKARDVFAHYGDLHKAKSTKDGDQKAAVNYARSMDLDEALENKP